jgi:predicted SAM-dependent methyltransferase
MSTLITRLKRTRNPAVRYALLRTRGAAHFALRGHAVRRAAVRRYLASEPEPKLHLGAGPYAIPGWLNSDLISAEIYLDVTRRLPFPDASFAYAFAEHLIEHVTEREAERLLADVHRVLRPGGVLRLTTPDLAKLIAIYEDRNPVVTQEDYAEYLDRETGSRHAHAGQIFNDYMRLWGHRYIYDEPDLRARLQAAGFDAIERREPGESPHAPLRGLERHGGEDWINRAEAMSLEATKA